MKHLIQQLRNRKQLRMPGNQKKNLHRMLQLIQGVPELIIRRSQETNG